ncbi:MAG: hypothetical protein CL833_06790 [Crocinitomicaceae bacterium]|nr:hypothetical protein [Crocinitomicaceae bacterium]|tara:strand:- start:74 stop:694 length:621 start_codon:yes stop_codon:yes gene_type:complete
MKATFFIISILIGTLSYAQIEAVEITPTYGYTINGSVTQYGQFYDVKDAVSFGGVLDLELAANRNVEVSYRRSVQTVQYVETFSYGEFEVGMEHFHIGIFQGIGKHDKIKPYWNFLLGGIRYYGQERRWLDVYRFSMAAGVGAKLFLTDNLGIRFQSQLALPMSYTGAGLFCDGSGYCSGGASFNVPIAHLDLSAGLILRISTKED